MPAIRAFVVDDEQLAREELCFLLGQVSDVEVIGQAADGVDALRQIGQLQPDVVFLDVQMPGLTGFEVARRLIEADVLRPLVFVTAFDQSAAQVASVDAVDYLLKPVDGTRLEESLQRVRKRLASELPSRAQLSTADLERIERAISALEVRQEQRDQVAIRVGERYLLVPASEISHASVIDETLIVATPTISGQSNYRTLDELQERLDPAIFWRLHRSHLVNIRNIKEVVPLFSRNYVVKMKDAKGTEIPVSRAQTKRLREYFGL
jgi:two-component system LytT family response regulator/two-component system response regulator LytT